MASEDVAEVSTEHRETSAEQLEESLASEQVVVSMEAASRKGAMSD
jgi:hypothetical protein